MAILSADGTYVTVQRGDSLWAIARKYLGNGNKYKQLAAINGIKQSKNGKWYIYPNQIIKLTGTANTSSSSSSTTLNSNRATITQFGVFASEANETLYVVWDWRDPNNTEEYQYEWEYTIKDTGNTWWTGAKSSTKDMELEYRIPDNAEQVRFRVKPISKTYTEKSGSGFTSTVTTKTYFEAEWTNFEKDGKYSVFNTSSLPPAPPGRPSAELDETDKLTLTTYLEGVDAEALDATHIQFQIVKDNISEFALSEAMSIDTEYTYVSYQIKLAPAGEYKVRCRSVRGNLHSAWSDYSSVLRTVPSTPVGFKACEAKSSSTDGKVSVYLAWDAVNSATSYDIEYATSLDYFDGTDQTTTISDITLTHHETYSLETGHEYFFRLRASNSGGKSGWSAILSSVKLGEPPAAPTTWSSTTTATVGGPLTLFWVHNAKDGSSQTYASLSMEIYSVSGMDDDGKPVYDLKWSVEETIKNATDVDEKDATSTFDATEYLAKNVPTYYKEGVQLRWRVRTSGVTNELGDWSIVRMVDIYAQPSVTLAVKDPTNTINTTFDTLGSFPIYISAITQPATQAPIGFHISIVSNNVYETVDSVGNNKMVTAGEQVYSKYFDQNTDLHDLVLSAGDVDLENSMNYTIRCIASMNSGLTAEASLTFTVAWEEVSYVPNASIMYDAAQVVTHIRPVCNIITSTYYSVNQDPDTGKYIASETPIESVYAQPYTIMYTSAGLVVYTDVSDEGETIYYYTDGDGNRVEITSDKIAKTENVYTTTGEQVYSGMAEVTVDENGDVTGGEEFLMCIRTDTELVDGVTLSVYRREFDGSFTELAKNIDNLKNTYITDPHPSLDYARYRIVATTDATGAVSYYDMPGYPIQEKAVIIQWDEDWSSFDAVSDDPLSQPPWSGSMIRLPYNIDVSDSYSTDVSLIEYVGRRRPVSYYGTQLGETSTWNVEIDKEDKETVYALRRLANWTGDAYVREPSGSGYWANINVSFNQKHRVLTIPVTLNIKRVEGGV